MKKKISFLIGIFVLTLIGIFFDHITNFIINVEWYKEVGYVAVFFTKVIATLKLMIPIFIISYLVIWIYYRSLRTSLRRWQESNDSVVGIGKSGNRIFIIFNILFSFIISYGFSTAYWYKILQFENAVNFNVKDPIFGLDVSFYVFKLPLIESIFGIAMSLLIFLVIITLAAYFILKMKDRVTSNGFKGFAKPFSGGSFIKSGITRFAGRQLAVVSSLIALMLSIQYVIKCLNLVYSQRGVVFGGGYTDVKVTLPLYEITAVICIISAIVIFISVLYSKIKPIIVSVTVIALFIGIEAAAAPLVQNLIVKSNEKTLEMPYINNNIAYTKKAFNIDKIDEKLFPVKNDLTKEDIADNKDTIDNIKINSFTQALEFYNQVQVIRYYYDFNDLDVDRYNINGKDNQVFIGAREINLNSLAGNANTWQNRHLIYTHGYGVVMNKVNSVTSEGQPDFVIKDIPPENSTSNKIDNPRIYFGEKTNDYSIVDTKIGEFDYPKGDSNQINRYDGKAGISMNLLNKLLFAIKERDFNFLLSRDITSESKILINRNITDRVSTIAPFLTYDKDPYVVLSNGRLCWVIDAYTISDKYPYSQPVSYGGINYIRNSIKVTVDAVDGTVNFYIVDKNDPIAESYKKIFPTLFKDADAVPKDINEHFRYPEDLFDIQCNVLGKYHVSDPNVFYNGEDLWEVAQNEKKVQGEKKVNESSYVYMRLPGESREEMILLEYFNMKTKDNMVAMYGARMDKDNYGKMILYKFPPQTTVYSPYMFKQKLNQDTTISKELSLWNKEGSEVQYGDTMIVPIKNSLIYIEPMYLRAQGKNSIPEMKRVIVSYSDKIILADNVQDALNQLFSIGNNNASNNNGKVNTTNDESGKVQDKKKLNEAKDLYDKAIESQKSGDWAKYGEYIKKLGDMINELAK